MEQWKRHSPLNSDQRCKILLFFFPAESPHPPTFNAHFTRGGSRRVIGRGVIGLPADWSVADSSPGVGPITTRCVDLRELLTGFIRLVAFV